MTQFNAPACSDFTNYIGIPYGDEHNRNPECLNCWQLCERIMVECFSIKPPHYVYTGEFNKVAPFFLMELAQWQKIDFRRRQPGDLLLMNVAGYPLHLGILVATNVMIHTLQAHGSVMESIKKQKWSKRITGVYRWPM